MVKRMVMMRLIIRLMRMVRISKRGLFTSRHMGTLFCHSSSMCFLNCSFLWHWKGRVRAKEGVFFRVLQDLDFVQ